MTNGRPGRHRKQSLRVVFVGGTARAVQTLKLLTERGDVDVVYALFMRGYPDEHVFARELAEVALTRGIEHDVEDKITPQVAERVRDLKPDVILGGGIWRSMVGREFYESATYGYLGLHGSGLPAYRGWAGINWYVINGEPEFVMRMYQLDEGIDSGPLVCDAAGNLLEYRISLMNEKHMEELLEEYAQVHVEAYAHLVDLLMTGDISFRAQDHAAATYTCHRGPDDAEIDWSQSTTDVFNFIRAQSRPYPGAFTFFNSSRVQIWRARPRYDYSNYVGRIVGKVVTRNMDTESVIILTRDGGIEVLEAEVDGETISPFLFFNTVRKRCQSKVEAFVERTTPNEQ